VRVLGWKKMVRLSLLLLFVRSFPPAHTPLYAILGLYTVLLMIPYFLAGFRRPQRVLCLDFREGYLFSRN